jgi:hypothetical protein
MMTARQMFVAMFHSVTIVAFGSLAAAMAMVHVPVFDGNSHHAPLNLPWGLRVHNWSTSNTLQDCQFHCSYHYYCSTLPLIICIDIDISTFFGFGFAEKMKLDAWPPAKKKESRRRKSVAP